MAESFDSFRYISYLEARWRQIAASAGIAVVLAGAISLAMPARYTATARIVIEPPAGADVRSSTAVSPIYLESLKTYEQFASSDSLFQNAVQRFQLSGAPIETLKRRVLKVETVRNTRILEISATLADPRKAQALAKFLADSTVELNRASLSESDQELLSGLEQQERDIRAGLERTEAAWSAAISHEPTAALESGIEEAASQRSTIEEQIQSEEVEIAGLQDRMKAGDSGGEMGKEVSNARARLVEMRRHMEDLDRQTAEREKMLGTRQAHRDQLSANREADQTALAAIEGRLRDARGQRGFRGERLQVIDPGIVPERPSSPNIPLNIAVALLAGLVLPILFFTLRFNFRERRASWERADFRSAVRTRDE
jgi:succinoglycan biosynthesis transport protein ExoP